ncbi:acyltransferase-domain-containing protein [Schizopora paradoxa]|uniref:Tafazzin family protein n=1 Tax=Schizopora paradoxa TaxID=27342 RepID=A0A0H2R6J3_9AGAM|nr:acyltransferase-domain-containing protein [Schizopora paradoxa]
MSAQASLSSCLTVAAVGLTCKVALNMGYFASVTVSGLHNLLDALGDEETRRKGRGVVTVCNHISVLDDPLIWGILPLRSYWNLRDMRWALGASDIMFTNPLFSKFFENGKVFETFRGKGIYQPAVDGAIEKLNDGGWVHLFGEGKVNQPDTYPITSSSEGRRARLPRFKWGTARIIMEVNHLPTVIPMWISGFNEIMPEPRNFPRFIPRPGANLTVTFGAPIDHAKITSVLDLSASPVDAAALQVGRADELRPTSDNATKLNETTAFGAARETEAKRAARCALTDLLQREVEAVGYRVSGSLLGKKILGIERSS